MFSHCFLFSAVLTLCACIKNKSDNSQEEEGGDEGGLFCCESILNVDRPFLPT